MFQRPATKGGKTEKDQRNGKGEVEGPDHIAVEENKIRQRQLKKGPGNGQHGDHNRAAGQAMRITGLHLFIVDDF